MSKFTDSQLQAMFNFCKAVNQTVISDHIIIHTIIRDEMDAKDVSVQYYSESIEKAFIIASSSTLNN